ncbi:MAG: NAD(P)H-binding protein [bacterium]|nr:NAD(P)H-binding protein [bacterium]
MKPLALVTGASGFVGSHVAERLLGSDFRVRLLVRDPRRLKWLQREQFELLVGDITGPESIDSAVDSTDVVIHCAGLTKGLNESDYMRTNADATAMLARASESAEVRRFVYCSSLACCGPSAS